jgi:hypothetical protein
LRGFDDNGFLDFEDVFIAKKIESAMWDKKDLEVIPGTWKCTF